MTQIISFFMSLITLISLTLPGFKYALQPVIEIDCADEVGEISSRASGYLYGLAESGVPSSNMAESLDISSASQKTADGLQHPVGDVTNVAENLDSCDYIVVYMQDCFDTWYYCYDEIMSLRESGEYDWKSFIEENFFPEVISQVEALSNEDYSGRIVYCLYNECDNSVWFGNEDENGNLQFDDVGRENFYEAWKMTYELVKSVDPDAMIGGPGYYEYNAEKISSFLSYCCENGCIPDVMIYHELSETSASFWEDHTEEYREIEQELGIEELPVIVTEYGCMDECGNPGDMLQYICSIEKSGTYGNVAFWRLANNLNDTAADSNTPNSNWWLYRWYADMEGQRLDSQVIDILHSDFANVIKYNRDRFHYTQLNGLSSINDEGDEVTVILGGCDYTSYAVLKNLKSTSLSGYVDVKIEAVYYEGLSGEVYEPVTVSEYTAKLKDTMKIKVECSDSSAVYRITVSQSESTEKSSCTNSNIPVRYEFENGELLGLAYTYDSAYATTGKTAGMVGGIENDGDGVSITVKADTEGLYQFKVIYGKANDGSSSDDRISAEAVFSVDGEETEVTLPNSIKSEYTSTVTLTAYLTKGTHTLTFTHKDGTYTLDSLLMSLYEDSDTIEVLPDSDRSDSETAAFLAVAPYDGFYTLTVSDSVTFLLDGAQCGTDENGTATVYLARGLNYIEIKNPDITECTILKSADEGELYTVTASDMTLSDGAYLNEAGGTVYVDGISSEGGSAEFTVSVPASGTYRMTFTYSNNREGGVHSYNVDLIECYVTVTVNGTTKDLWCRNTQSTETFKTVTMNVELTAGENTVTLTNSGETTFNNTASYTPNISQVSVAAVCG
ncbi:MAG: hypothetical protein LUG85_01990 [Clostridiales bacterium]|nr:hypothetical protein [Clostridiales bacterium]